MRLQRLSGTFNVITPKHEKQCTPLSLIVFVLALFQTVTNFLKGKAFVGAKSNYKLHRKRLEA